MENRFPLKIVFIPLLAIVGVIITACQDEPRTEFLMEVTRQVTVVVVATDDGTQDESPASDPATVAPTVPTATVPPITEASNEQASSPTPAPTENLIPDPILQEIIVAEQNFERGRMIYIQPRDEIWVLFGEDGEADSGDWGVYADTWEEGEPEFDPDLTPPSEDLVQPERGFGKLWRDEDDVRNRLGWALAQEEGHVTLYQYYYGGEVVAGEFVQGPGQHFIASKDDGVTFIFEEATETWRISQQD